MANILQDNIESVQNTLQIFRLHSVQLLAVHNYISHCDLTVLKAADGSAQSMTVMKLKYSFEKEVLVLYFINLSIRMLFNLLSMPVMCHTLGKYVDIS